MPDITMCLNDECEVNHTCFRYKAEPSEIQQSYAKFEPFYNDYDQLDCDHYLDIIERE